MKSLYNEVPFMKRERVEGKGREGKGRMEEGRERRQAIAYIQLSLNLPPCQTMALCFALPLS